MAPREWNRAFYKTHHDPEVLSQEDKVERTGYRSIADQVKPLLQAGVRLANARKGLYQYTGDEDDDTPTISMTSDVFEVMDSSKKVQSNLNASFRKQQDLILEQEKEKIGQEWAKKNIPPAGEVTK